MLAVPGQGLTFGSWCLDQSVDLLCELSICNRLIRSLPAAKRVDYPADSLSTCGLGARFHLQ
jgi:hypothetical protein